MTVSGYDLETEVVIQPECGRRVACKAFVRQQKTVETDGCWKDPLYCMKR